MREDVELIVNRVIKQEWKRVSEKEIIQQNQNLKNLIREISKYINLVSSQGLHIPEKMIAGYFKNKKSDIENLIKNATYIKTTNKIKNKVINQSLNNKAPFHKNKNSVADGIIMFDSILFAKENLSSEIIFVTGNFKDFSNINNKHDLHNDFTNEVTNNFQYFLNLGEALNHIRTSYISQDAIRKIDTRLNLNELYSTITENIYTDRKFIDSLINNLPLEYEKLNKQLQAMANQNTDELMEQWKELAQNTDEIMEQWKELASQNMDKTMKDLQDSISGILYIPPNINKKGDTKKD